MSILAIVGGCLGSRNRHTITAGLPYSVLDSIDSGNLAFDETLHAFVGRLEVHGAQLRVYASQLTWLANHSLLLLERLLLELLCRPPGHD